MKIRLIDESGFTIVEVLVSTVVFLIGFSILVALINGTTVKLSVKELELGTALGQEFMTLATTYRDTADIDTVVNRSNLGFKIKKHVEIDDKLAKCLVTVYRLKTGSEIIGLYGEFYVSE